MAKIDFALVVNLKAKRGQADQLIEAASVVARAQEDHEDGRRFLVYRDFHFDQGQFKYVFPLKSIGELDHPPGQTFRVTKEVFGKEGELAAKQFIEAIGTVQSDIIARNDKLSNGRGGSDGAPSAYIRQRELSIRPDFDCPGAAVKVSAALKKAGRHYATYKVLTGSEFTFHIISRMASLAELDEKPTLRSLLRQAYGDNEGDEILRQHREGVIDSTSKVFSYAPDISNI